MISVQFDFIYVYSYVLVLQHNSSMYPLYICRVPQVYDDLPIRIRTEIDMTSAKIMLRALAD